MLVRLCALMHQRGFLWTDFRDLWYWALSQNSVEKIQILLKSGKNIRHFTWRPNCVQVVDNSMKYFDCKRSQFLRFHGNTQMVLYWKLHARQQQYKGKAVCPPPPPNSKRGEANVPQYFVSHMCKPGVRAELVWAVFYKRVPATLWFGDPHIYIYDVSFLQQRQSCRKGISSESVVLSFLCNLSHVKKMLQNISWGKHRPNSRT